MSFEELFQFMMIILTRVMGLLESVVIAGIPLLGWIIFSSIICSLLILIFRTSVRDPIKDMYGASRQVAREGYRQQIKKRRG